MRSTVPGWVRCGVLACAASSLASWCGPCQPLLLEISSSPRGFAVTSAPVEVPFTVRTPAVIDEVSVTVSNARSSRGAVSVHTSEPNGAVTEIAPGASDTIALCTALPCRSHYDIVIEPSSAPASVTLVTHAAAHSNQCEDFYIDVVPE